MKEYGTVMDRRRMAYRYKTAALRRIECLRKIDEIKNQMRQARSIIHQLKMEQAELIDEYSKEESRQ